VKTDCCKYLRISKSILFNKHLSEWPVADAVAIFNLIDELSGGSRFWSEKVELRVKDAAFEIQEIISM